MNQLFSLHIVRNPVTHDSRVLKETYSLVESGTVDNLVIAGFHENGLPERERLPGRYIRRIRISTRQLPKDLFSQSIKYAEWFFRLIDNFGKSPLSIIHCHDLAPLPIAVRLKQLTGAKLVYDAHELETEMAGSKGLRQILARMTERRLISSVDAMITVSPSIREWYGLRYPNIPISIVRNVPEKPSGILQPEPLRQRFQLPDDALLFIYLGGLQKGRGVERILHAFLGEQVLHHVLFMGSGLLKETVTKAAETSPRIHYLPPVPPADVLRYAAGADVGLSLIEDICLSYRYSLPNKLFETLLAGVPVLASDLPDQAEIVNRYNGGWIVPNGSGALSDCLVRLEAETARQLRRDLPLRTEGLSWQSEAETLLSVYNKLRKS